MAANKGLIRPCPQIVLDSAETYLQTSHQFQQMILAHSEKSQNVSRAHTSRPMKARTNKNANRILEPDKLTRRMRSAGLALKRNLLSVARDDRCERTALKSSKRNRTFSFRVSSLRSIESQQNAFVPIKYILALRLQPGRTDRSDLRPW